MNFNEKIQNERKKHLGLDKVDTEKVYTTIINCYKKKLIEAPREILGYSIDIVMCNMNYYNKLGDLKSLNNKWGDTNFYVDLRNSSFLEQGVDDEGNIESYDSIAFNDLKELKELEDMSYSLKEMIDLCKKDNFNIKIFADSKEDYETTIEITPYQSFEENNSINVYLDTLK